MSMKTVGILISSEEILRGKKSDRVSEFLIKELNNLQYSVNKITVIPNRESYIINELELLIKSCDIIIAVSEKCGNFYRALGFMISQQLHESEELIRLYKEQGINYDKDDICLPIQTKILRGSNLYPVAYFQRIFFVREKHLKQSYNLLKNHLVQYRKERNCQKTIQISQNGSSVDDLKELNKISNNCIKVDFSKNHDFFNLKISSSQMSHIVDVEGKIRDKFEEYRLKFVDNSEVWDEVYKSEERHVKNSIESIERCLSEYGPNNVFVSFNGGKDCTVLLHLVLAVLKKKHPEYKKPIFCLYVQSDKPFPEQDEFISQTKSYYNLKIMTIRSNIKNALQQTLEKFPNYKACFMGTRRTDPYSSDLNVFQMTDSNWPQIMRVSPLLDWHYSDVWDYLLYHKVPYCKLYDMGFTSLGNTVNTTQNPSLIYYDHSENREMYLPAYKLLKENKERNGRNSS